MYVHKLKHKGKNQLLHGKAKVKCHTCRSPKASVRSLEPRAASQHRKLRQRASVEKAACFTHSSGHKLGSRQASLKRRLTRGTWRSLHRRTQQLASDRLQQLSAI